MPVYRKFRALAAAAVLVSAAGAALAAPAAAKDGDAFGAWSVHCPKEPGATAKDCRLMQIDDIKDKDGKPVKALRASIFHLGEKDFVLGALLPLGYSIPPGVRISVDDGQEHELFAQRCVPQGCEVAAKIEPALMAQLKKGKEAKIKFHLGSRTGIIPVSLKGLSEGLSKF
ncbi:invasion associated locus B family protein [Oleispirillum naphthae]|uniref:invasion associated locus B family protein n=1 Tax=Oleispirillum naphthae TaxID=2838853 RepID=UPI00308263A8